ncbi:MAG: YceI family protein [Chloroflexi bacterium]|nr:YceI family protein [Chloroflexota bacterium]MCI0575367.1 YceI family protein [Chloroflexota bacterium]MCI0646385.1 YceI family protein [Chloroflexota bacterium]MCI0728357.1 YceI family protein [Chloroflexota bacterium]
MSWQIDSAHSRIYFVAHHMMMARVRGQFEKFGGIIQFDDEEPTNTLIDITINAASLNTNEPQRDAHLRSADFLDAENYPVLRFQSKRVEQLDENTGRLIGDLTIRGVTREVALDVEHLGQGQNPWGATSAGFTASASINRKDWGLTWNRTLETGGVLVSDKINIEIELELVKQPEAVAV